MTKSVADVLEHLAEAERLYGAGEIERAGFAALNAMHLTTFLPWSPADPLGPLQRDPALLDLLGEVRPYCRPEQYVAAAREHVAREEWTAAAVALADLTGLLMFLSHRLPGETTEAAS